jgi:Bacterial Ig domain
VQLLDLRGGIHGAVAVAVLMGISSCGGGGGGGPPPNPVLGTTTFSTIENLPVKGAITATDPGGAAVTFTQGSSPKSGTLSGFTSAGAFVYTPNQGFTGSDSFTVTATDTAKNATTGTVTITVNADQAPTVTNTIQSSNSPTPNVNVLANASSPTKETLTVTVNTGMTFPAPAMATVNSDQSITVANLPPNFKGLTTFEYTVKDQSGLSTKGAAAIFVGTNPFRTAFVADSGSAGAGSYEVYLTDFAAAAVKESAATQGTLRLQGFAISDDGATIVYRTQDTNNAASTSLSLVQTATPGTPVGITLPNSAAPVVDASGKDQFVVSPDGKWIAVIAGQGGSSALYVVQVSASPVVTSVVPTIAGTPAVFATQPSFTVDSKNVYFLATSVAGGANKSLYVAAVSALATPVLVSKLSDPAANEDVSAYSVALNQLTIVEQASRSGRVGLFLINPKNLQSEIPLNPTPGFGQFVTTSTVGLAPTLGGSSSGDAVAYNVGDASGADAVGAYVVNFTAATTSPPPAQTVAPAGNQVIGLSPPDDSKVLYTDGSQVFEVPAAGGAPTQLGPGTQGWYDSTANIVLLAKSLSSGLSLRVTERGSFGSSQPIPTGSTATYDVDVSGFQNGVVVLGSVTTSGTTTLGLVNALAPGDTFTLTGVPGSSPPLPSPVQLTSYASKVTN